MGAPSSSVTVRVRLEGAITPRRPLTAADTVTDLSGSSTPLSTPVMVTVPVLLVEPGAMVRILLEEMAKSPATAGDTGDADTTTVTACGEGLLRNAVTLAVPTFSLMEVGLRSSVTVGATVVVGDGQRYGRGVYYAQHVRGAAGYMDRPVGGVHRVVDGAEGQRGCAGGRRRRYGQRRPAQGVVARVGAGSRRGADRDRGRRGRRRR